MDRLVDRVVDLTGLELTLRRIVVGARVVAAVWTAILAVVALVRGDVDRAVTALLIVGGIALWALASALVYRRAPDAVTTRFAHGVDAVAGSIALLSVGFTGTEAESSFTGGLPLIVVAIAAVRSRLAAWLMAGVMIAVTTVRGSTEAFAEGVVGSISQIILYSAGALIFSWVLAVLRSSEASRVAAERLAADAESARALERERADISRHLHDSVLQTLAMVQRSEGATPEITMLARRQERELRNWLFGDRAVDGHFADALRSVASEVEERSGVVVEVVTVGDAALDDRLGQLVAAAREAIVNAASHASVPSISVYGEAGDGGARVYVRDRGRGFDPDSIPADRRGISESIRGRLEDVGGKATVRSASGSGTEWTLEVS